MENIFDFIVLGLIVIEIAIYMYCEYWRELHPWKWFFVKLLTTVSVIIMICWGKECYENHELIAVAIFGIATGIDFAHTYITVNNTKMID
jgi:hypothetical protein